MPRLTRRRMIQGLMAAPLLLNQSSFAQTAGTAGVTVFTNGRVTTFDQRKQDATAIAVLGDSIVAVGSDREVLAIAPRGSRVVDLGNRRVIPGLNDSHMHFVRGSLSYNLDVRWDGVPSLEKALELLRVQAGRTPAGQWVRVGGGWSQFQFKEKRPPTIAELNAVAPNTPVYVLYFYDRCYINAAGLKALGMTDQARALPGGIVQVDAHGHPTGVFEAHPFPATITAPEAKMPTLPARQASNSIIQFMGELNRLGMTSVVDPGGVGQPYPQMYLTLSQLAREHALSLRVGMYLLPQDSGSEVEDFENYMQTVRVGGDEHWFRYVGGGEILVQKAMDWDLYTTPPVEVADAMVEPLAASIRTLMKRGWYVREHATFDHTISLYLDALQRVKNSGSGPMTRWSIDHAEFISEHNLERVASMGGGIAIQHRAAFHGELGTQNFGAHALTMAPPVKRMLSLGIPVGIGTDATRDTTYNPWVCVQWLVTGKTVGGTQLTPVEECLDVGTALRLYTQGSAWFSGEEAVKGSIAPGRFADFAVLSQDVLQVAPEEISKTESLLTVVGGRAVHGVGPFAGLAPPPLPVEPAWSPAAGMHPGYYR